MDEEKEKRALAESLIQLVSNISTISDYRSSIKKEYSNLARRLKLLTPMFEEIRDNKNSIQKKSLEPISSLFIALNSAHDLLRFGSQASQIYLVLEREKIMLKYQEVTEQLEKALSAISYEELQISDEVTEQVELVHAQFKRAKGRIDPPDTELYEDLLTLSKVNETQNDPDVLTRLVNKLQLNETTQLTQESVALQEMITSSNNDQDENITKTSILFKKIKDFVQIQTPDIDNSTETKLKNLVIPDDFRCPISLELMTDPVIVSTGQTYERSSIEKWIKGATGHKTCPKTQQILTNNTLTPNYVLRSLIDNWCTTNGIEPPKRVKIRPNSNLDEEKIEALIRKLSSNNTEDECSAACEIRLLAKRNSDNRITLAEAGVIPLLVNLLLTQDKQTQEHVITALLNLSINEDNKKSIVALEAVPGIVHVLKYGTMEARENAAATLFSLSVTVEVKKLIGLSGAIYPLVMLLRQGNIRGKKDAATALFNLCIYEENRVKAVGGGVVPVLVGLLTDMEIGMVDESLAILAILASHTLGKVAIGEAKALPILVDIIKNGSPKNKENSSAILVNLLHKRHYLIEAMELGIKEPLLDLVETGTERSKRKATQLLERINRFAESQSQGQSQSQNA